MPPYPLLPPPGDCLLHEYRQAQRAVDIARKVFGVEELAATILGELDLPELLQTKLVCKDFKATIESSPDMQKTLFRRHLRTDIQTARMNRYFSRTAAGILAQWHSAIYPLQYPPLVGNNCAFIVSTVNPRLLGAGLTLHMRMENWGVKRCHDWRKLHPNGLESTLLCTHEILGDWAITVADDDWEFVVSRQMSSGRGVEARSRQRTRHQSRMSDVNGEVPINGTVGELMQWLEEYIEMEKAKFATTMSERFTQMLFVVGWSTALLVAFGGSAQCSPLGPLLSSSHVDDEQP